MISKRIIREITPLTEESFFVVLNHFNAKFDFPIHYHPEFELNLVLNSSGKRIIGDSIEEYGEIDLVLVGSNTPHGWTGDSKKAHVVTIQFHTDFLSDKDLSRKLMLPIKEMLDRSKQGIKFSVKETSDLVKRIKNLTNLKGFDSLLEFLSIMYHLSVSENQIALSSSSYIGQIDTAKSRRIKIVNEYLYKNLGAQIMLKDVAHLVNMSPSAFSHFFKRRTQRSFSSYLTGLRVGSAAKLLIETEKTVSEICFESGFNNVSNFNRSFKSQRGCTPTEFRSQQRLITEH